MERGNTGSYETVKRFVRPLRRLQAQSEGTMTRFETPPGQQSQVDWGQSRVRFRDSFVVQHLFVLAHARMLAPELLLRVPQ